MKTMEEDIVAPEYTAKLDLDRMTLAALVGARQRIKQQLELEAANYEKKIMGMTAAMLKIEGAVTNKMNADALDNVKTPYGTAYFSNVESMRVTNRENFFGWVLSNVDNGSFDVLTSAVSKDAIRARGVIPAGVEVTKFRKLCIRKPT
jgi:hypothetical protein